MLLKSEVKAKPSVLWCYKKSLSFGDHRQKKLKSVKKKIEKSGKSDINENDLFESFIASADIRYCYYKDTHTILGNTYGMCVLQDFEALTPNLLARTIETVQGGGLIVLLLQTVASLKQLYTMSMDVHQRFRTESHKDVVGRFNERFLLSLASCKRCLVVDDQLRILPISSKNLTIEPVPKATSIGEPTDLDILKDSFKETKPVSVLLNCCKTVDQAKALLKFIETITEKTLRSTVSLTSARGRGKSATLGLSIAAAISFGYSNIYLSSPSPENLNTLFEFVVKGFDALAYQLHMDYEVFRSTNPEFNKAIIRIVVSNKEQRQIIQYIHPTDAQKLGQAELLVIDEAAAIPLPYVKAMLGPYLVFLSSTINGYEGTGRSLSLKLIQKLREQSVPDNSHGKKNKDNTVVGRQLYELTLDESIRYKPGDDVETWLTNLLCLDAMTNAPILSGCPSPDLCQLYYINRDTLFSYHKASEVFLQRLVALYVSSHYKNSPNDLQMMSDAPAHHLFCLLGPVNPNRKTLPEILVIIQVCLEGELSAASVSEGLGRGKRAAGDLIPWTLAQQYQDNNFPKLSGARIVRIAVHPDYQGMKYGSKAIELLKQYYEMKIPNIDETIEENNEIKKIDEEDVDLLEETIKPRASLPPLLLTLNERRPERLDYLGVSFGMTLPLLKFWKRANFVPLYLRQTTNDITGEHSCIMISKINNDDDQDFTWLEKYWEDFRRRFINLLSFSFSSYSSALALEIINNKAFKLSKTVISKTVLDTYFTSYDIKRLETYSDNKADYHMIMDLLPALSRMYFLNLMGDTDLPFIQQAILLGLGLQHKTIEKLSEELQNLQTSQILALFVKLVIKSVRYLNGITEAFVEGTMMINERQNDNITVDIEKGESLQKELEDGARKLSIQQKQRLEELKQEAISEEFTIKVSAEDCNKALTSKGNKSLLSIKTGDKRRQSSVATGRNFQEDGGKKKKKKRFSK